MSDFDQALESWLAQNPASAHAANRDALRQALQTEEARVRQELGIGRLVVWFFWIFGTGMAVWAGFWIAITITNGWPSIYVSTSAVSLLLFTFAAGATWVSRGREPQGNFGNTLQDEVKRSLALGNYQLSRTKPFMLGAASLVVGTLLFSWTTINSQEIPDSSSGGGWFWFIVLFVFLGHKGLDEMRTAKAKLDLRQRRLHELLGVLQSHE